MESRSVRAGWRPCHSPSRKRITKMSKKSQRRKSQVARRMVTCRCQDNLAHMCSTVAQYSFEGVWMRLFSLRTCEKKPAAEADPKSSRKAPRTKKTTAAGNRKKAQSVWSGNLMEFPKESKRDVTSPNLCDRAAAWRQRLVFVWLSCLSPFFDEAKLPGFGSVSGQCARLSSLQDSTNVEGQRLCKKPPGHRICVDYFAVNHPSPAVSCNPLSISSNSRAPQQTEACRKMRTGLMFFSPNHCVQSVYHDHVLGIFRLTCWIAC